MAEKDKLAVYRAINAVQADLAHEGIGKDRKNTQQNYSFRGIDDVYNALSPLLAKHKLCILPRIIKREVVERESRQGGALFYTTVEAEFDFVSAEDGSLHIVKTFGEAMDSADKSTNKAMSAAYKYAAVQAFAIPTEGDNDTESSHHEVKSRARPATNGSVRPSSAPTTKTVFWENLRTHCSGNNSAAGNLLKELTGKQFFSDLTEAEAVQGQLKFEQEIIGGRQ